MRSSCSDTSPWRALRRALKVDFVLKGQQNFRHPIFMLPVVRFASLFWPKLGRQQPASEPDANLVKALTRAHEWLGRLVRGEFLVRVPTRQPGQDRRSAHPQRLMSSTLRVCRHRIFASARRRPIKRKATPITFRPRIGVAHSFRIRDNASPPIPIGMVARTMPTLRRIRRVPTFLGCG
jgi:hypothetical protein